MVWIQTGSEKSDQSSNSGYHFYDCSNIFRLLYYEFHLNYETSWIRKFQNKISMTHTLFCVPTVVSDFEGRKDPKNLTLGTQVKILLRSLSQLPYEFDTTELSTMYWTKGIHHIIIQDFKYDYFKDASNTSLSRWGYCCNLLLKSLLSFNTETLSQINCLVTFFRFWNWSSSLSVR